MQNQINDVSLIGFMVFLYKHGKDKIEGHHRELAAIAQSKEAQSNQ